LVTSGAGLTIGVLFWLMKSAATHKPKIDSKTGNKYLYNGMFYLAFGILCFIISCFLIWVCLTQTPQKNLLETFLFIIVTIFFIIVGVALILEWKKAQVIISNSGIYAKAAWPWYPKSIEWEEVTNVSLSPLMNSYVITGKNVTIRINYYMYGIDYLGDAFKKYLFFETYSEVSNFVETIKNYALQQK